jgi:hypothetical protein
MRMIWNLALYEQGPSGACSFTIHALRRNVGDVYALPQIIKEDALSDIGQDIVSLYVVWTLSDCSIAALPTLFRSQREKLGPCPTQMGS